MIRAPATFELDLYQRALERFAQSYAPTTFQDAIGRVTAVGDGVVEVRGLENVALGEPLAIEGGPWGWVLELRRDGVGAVLLGPAGSTQVGSVVRPLGEELSLPVGERLLGRVVDPLGQPLDGGEPVEGTRQPLERPAPPIVDRAAITTPLLTGYTVADALFPIGRGQRQLVIGDRGTGKSTFVLDTVLNQVGQGVRCIYVCVGQKAGAVVALLRVLRQHDAMAHTTVVVGSAEASPGLRYLAPYAGSTLAEYFRDRGEDALVVYDDLTAHAVAYREVCLLLRRPPGREAYPSDIFYAHARLLERATHLHPRLGGGSLTALPVVETEAGRIADFIPTNLISITDGQLYFSRERFDRGFKPAVELGLSVSRVGGRTQRAGMKAVAGRLRLDMTQFAAVEIFSRFGARIEERTRQLIARGERLRELLVQPPHQPLTLGEQVALLALAQMGVFDSVPVASTRAVAAKVVVALRARPAGALALWVRADDPGPEARESLRELGQAVAHGWLQGGDGGP